MTYAYVYRHQSQGTSPCRLSADLHGECNRNIIMHLMSDHAKVYFICQWVFLGIHVWPARHMSQRWSLMSAWLCRKHFNSIDSLLNKLCNSNQPNIEIPYIPPLYFVRKGIKTKLKMPNSVMSNTQQIYMHVVVKSFFHKSSNLLENKPSHLIISNSHE